jgi:hypothetical protein
MSRSSLRLALKRSTSTSVNSPTLAQPQKIILANDLHSTIIFAPVDMESKYTLLLKTFSLNNDTFVNMYAYPDHNTSEPWLKLNDCASKLCLGDKFEEVLMDDSQMDKLVCGPVVLKRVDANGNSLDMTRDHFFML